MGWKTIVSSHSASFDMFVAQFQVARCFFFSLSLSLSHRWCSTFYFAKSIGDFVQPWISVEVISSYFLLHGDSSPIRGIMFRFFSKHQFFLPCSVETGGIFDWTMIMLWQVNLPPLTYPRPPELRGLTAGLIKGETSKWLISPDHKAGYFLGGVVRLGGGLVDSRHN